LPAEVLAPGINYPANKMKANKMKKEIILKSVFVTLIITGLFVIASVAKQSHPVIGVGNFVFAQNDMNKAAEDLAQGSPIKEPGDIFRILAKIVQYTYTIFFIVAVVFIIVAAFNFLTAQGNPEKINSAKSQITWAIVAIAIALISVGAAQIIKAFITP